MSHKPAENAEIIVMVLSKMVGVILYQKFHDMLEKQFWIKKKINEVISVWHLVGSEWVFKKKKPGPSWAWLIALGNHQIPGIDYTKNFIPVICGSHILMTVLYQ